MEKNFMSVPKFVRAGVAGFALAALVAPSAAVAAEAPYPPVVPNVSSTVSSAGRVTVVLSADVVATQFQAVFGGKHLEAIPIGTAQGNNQVAYSADFALAKLLPKTAGRYEVRFVIEGNVTHTFYKTFTVGKAVKLTNVKATKTAKGVRVTGKALKNSRVKIVIRKYGKVVAVRYIKTDKNGRFTYNKSLSSGDFKATVRLAPNEKYYSSSVSKSFTRLTSGLR
jgi:hypothetical protein